MKKNIKFLFISLIAIFLFVPTVNARLEDNFLASDEVSVVGEKDATIFAAGNIVNIDGEVNGITFGAGNNVSVKGRSEYSFISGNTINFNDYGARDIWIAGNSIILNNVNIERESYIVGSYITITGDMGRSTYIGGGTVVISGNFKGGLTIDAAKITIKEGTVIEGALKHNEDANIEIEEGTSIGVVDTFKNPEINKEGMVAVTTGAIILGKIMNVINHVVIGLVLLAILPMLFNRIDKIGKDAGTVLKEGAIGLVALICIPFVSIILLLTGVATALGIITLITYGILLYLSIIFAAYYLTMILLGKKTNKYLAMLLGVVVLSIIQLLPFVGGFISFIVLIIGLGVFISAIFNKR